MSLVLNTDVRNHIAAVFPVALPEIEKSTGEDEVQQIIEFHLNEALDAPGALTQRKVEHYYEIIRVFYPSRFLTEKFEDISSIFTQVIYLRKAFKEIFGIRNFTVLQGATKPLLIKSSWSSNPPNFAFGVFKKQEESDSMIRERLSYLVDKKNVPPTFIIDAGPVMRKGSFQLFVRDAKILDKIGPRLSSFSFSSSHIRDLAFSEIRRVNRDPSKSAMLICSDEKTCKFIDGSQGFPSSMTYHRISCLFIDDVFRQYLLTPFSPSELSYIEQINIDAACELLKKHQLDGKAIQIQRCALLLLKEVIPFNQSSSRSITLEDLLVITNISNPHGHRFEHQRGNMRGYAYGFNTLFSTIASKRIEGSDSEIQKRIRTQFSFVIEMKDRNSRRPDVRDSAAVYDYYHDKNKALFFSYFRNTNGSDFTGAFFT